MYYKIDMFKKIVIYTLFIIFCLTIFSTVKAKSSNNNSFLEKSKRAGKFLEENQPQKALKTAKELAKKFPQRSGAYQLLARVYTVLYEKGKVTPEKVLDAFKKAIEIDSENPRVWNNLAVYYNKLGRTKKVKEAVVRSIKLNPNIPFPYMTLGENALKEGKYKVALIHFLKAKNYLESISSEKFREKIKGNIEEYIDKAKSLIEEGGKKE